MSYPQRIMHPAQHRLNELLDAIKQEFENVNTEASTFRLHKDEFDQRFNQQTAEMQQIRQTIYDLEMQHRKMKESYEEEILRLKRELEARGTSGHYPSEPPRLYGAGGQYDAANGTYDSQAGAAAAAAGGPSGPPPPPNPVANVPPPPPQPSASAGAGSGVVAPAAGEAENGISNGAAVPSAGAGAPPATVGAAAAGAPASHEAAAAAATAAAAGAGSGASTDVAAASSGASPEQTAILLGNNLGDLDIDKVPDHLKKVKDDWFVVYNERAPRQIDVEMVQSFEHNSVVCCVRFSLDGKYVATGCNRSAQIYDVFTGQLICRLADESVADREGDLYIRSVCFSPDGRYLATGAEDKQIRVWDIKSRTIKYLFSGHEQDIYSLDYSRNGRHIASGSGDRTVRLWDMENGQCTLTLSIEDGVTTVAISPDGRFVAAGSLDRTVRVWDTTSGFLIERLEAPDGHKDSVYSVAFTPNGQDLVSGSLDKTLKLWELQAPRGSPATHTGGVCVKTFVGHRDFVLSVASTPDAQWILSGSKDRGVQFWDPRTAQVQLMLQGHKNSVISVAPSPQGNPMGGLFATGSGDCRARIWRYYNVSR